MGKRHSDDTFMVVTNKEIYDSIQDMHKTIRELSDRVQETNGKVKYNSGQIRMLWASFTVALLSIVSILIWFFQNSIFK